ncbi:MAG: hypothetical protein GY704_09950, partial [Phycisphaeraceae bacterium]|nr:hypothetical protein [Phycisphaeraceae bacterium]
MTASPSAPTPPAEFGRELEYQIERARIALAYARITLAGITSARDHAGRFEPGVGDPTLGEPMPDAGDVGDLVDRPTGVNLAFELLVAGVAIAGANMPIARRGL